MKRPLKNKRPFGPFIDSTTADRVASTEDSENESGIQTQENSNDPVLEQAETWWENINDESNKRKMMRNYFKSMTDLSDQEIDQKLDKAGL